MARVLFYEKPGCVTNARQKAMLTEAGHTLDVRNMLTEPWTAERLLAFFGDRPVTQWFNRAAPRVKSGEVDPAKTDADAAIALMLADPLLIRRPLMQVEGWHYVGFEAQDVDAAIGLKLERASDDARPIEGCAHGDTGKVCATPA